MSSTQSPAATQWNEKVRGFRAVAKGEGLSEKEADALIAAIEKQPEKDRGDLLQAKVAELVEANLVVAEHKKKKQSQEADTLHSLQEVSEFLAQKLKLSDKTAKALEAKVSEKYQAEDSFPIIKKSDFSNMIEGVQQLAKVNGSSTDAVVEHNLVPLTDHVLKAMEGEPLIFTTTTPAQNQAPNSSHEKQVNKNTEQDVRSPKNGPHQPKDNHHPKKDTDQKDNPKDKQHTGAAVAAGVAAATAGFFASRELSRRDEIKHTQAPTQENKQKMEFSNVKAVAWGALAVGALALAVHYGTGGKFTEMVKNSFKGAGQAR